MGSRKSVSIFDVYVIIDTCAIPSVAAEVVMDFPLMYYKAIAVDGSKIGSKFCYLEGVDV